MLLQMVLFHSLTPWKWKRQWLSHVWNELGLSQLFATLWTVALQAPLPMGSSRQEYWSGVPFPSLGDLPKSGIKPRSPALAGGFLTTEPPGKPKWNHKQKQKATYTIGSTFKIYLESTFLPTHHSDPNHHFSPGYSNSLLTKLPLSAPLTAESPWGGGSGPTERRSGPISLGSKSCSGFSLPAPAPLRAVLTCPLHLQAIPPAPPVTTADTHQDPPLQGLWPCSLCLCLFPSISAWSTLDSFFRPLLKHQWHPSPSTMKTASTPFPACTLSHPALFSTSCRKISLSDKCLALTTRSVNVSWMNEHIHIDKGVKEMNKY